MERIKKYEYRYEVLQKKHVEQAIAMMTYAFCDAEPMTHYLGIDYDTFRPFAERVCQKAANDGLSIVALDGDIVIACDIVEDITDPVNLEDPPLNPKFKYIFALLEQLSNSFFIEKVFKKNHLAHLFITAVAAPYRRQGISRQLNLRSSQLAAEKNFAFMYCEFTNYFNEKGTIKYLNKDKLLLGSCLYKDFIFDGVKPFAELDGWADAYMWELQAGAKLAFF